MKLAILNAAVSLNNLKVPPGNHLEALRHDRIGQHGIRINDKYRICFVCAQATLMTWRSSITTREGGR